MAMIVNIHKKKKKNTPLLIIPNRPENRIHIDAENNISNDNGDSNCLLRL